MSWAKWRAAIILGPPENTGEHAAGRAHGTPARMSWGRLLSMMYLRQPDQLEYFAQNEWIDTPARMLAPLIVNAVASSGAFRAVVQTPSVAKGEIRLDTEILRLQHEFLSIPSQVRFTLRAYLADSQTRRVIATREFDTMVATAPLAKTLMAAW